jgi:hypothetical protein
MSSVEWNIPRLRETNARINPRHGVHQTRHDAVAKKPDFVLEGMAGTPTSAATFGCAI